MSIDRSERIEQNTRELRELQRQVDALTVQTQSTVREIWWARTAKNENQSPPEQYPATLDDVWFWARLMERYNPAVRPYSPTDDANLTQINFSNPGDPDEDPKWIQIFSDKQFLREGGFFKVWRYVNQNEWFVLDDRTQVFREGVDQDGTLILTTTGLSSPEHLVTWSRASSGQHPRMGPGGDGAGIATTFASVDNIVFNATGWYQVSWGAIVAYTSVSELDGFVTVDTSWETDTGTSGGTWTALSTPGGREGPSGNGARRCIVSPEVPSGAGVIDPGEVAISGAFYNRFESLDRLRLRGTRTATAAGTEPVIKSAYFILAPLYQVNAINAPGLTALL